MRLREKLGHRMGSAMLALAIEALVLLALLTLGQAINPPEKPTASLVSIAVHSSDTQKKPDQPAKKPETPKKAASSPPPAFTPAPQAAQPPSPAPVKPPPPAFIPVNPQAMASLDISKLPRSPSIAPGRGRMGPADSDAEPDSQRVGTAPGGQALYAASWYRKPYDDELAGYLSTAQGPGWGLIACKTAPEYRVVDCVALDEYPQGSRIASAVLAAAWQFKVRPPRVGGVPQVGDWVRIRIDYGFKAKS